jgi:dihydroneopterin aldolase
MLGQTFLIDAELEIDLTASGASDDLRDTVDYGGLAGRLVTVVRDERYELIERLATRLAQECLTDQRVTAVTITVHKPAAPVPVPVADVAVSIRRSR